jgi:hypothetical protein
MWAYRARGQDPLVQVAVVRLGVKTPQRVLVRFVDDEFEGRQDWVPPARLKVPWSGVDEYVARERRWDEMLRPSADLGRFGHRWRLGRVANDSTEHRLALGRPVSSLVEMRSPT